MAGIAPVGAVDDTSIGASAGAPRLVVSLAAPSDDRELRELLRRSVIPGAVRVAFTRDPDYFANDGVAGANDVTVIARRDGRLVAMGRCSVTTLHRDGQPQRIGYLGALRVAEGTPESARVLREGYARIAEATENDSVHAFVTSIADDNTRARRVLEHGGRFGLPHYRRLAALVTLVAPVRATREPSAAWATHADAAELANFLQGHARQAHLTLAWDNACWASLARHGITARDFAIVRRSGRLVAAAAVWDQRPFRQAVIDGYDGWLRLARPVVNALSAVAGYPSLPPPGAALAQGALLGVAVPDPQDWPPLWHLLQRRAAASGLSWLTHTRDARDPHLGVLRRLLRPRTYHTTLYEVAWRNGQAGRGGWDARPFRPEVGLL